jgi:CHASE2 domain-containing sensor protein
LRPEIEALVAVIYHLTIQSNIAILWFKFAIGEFMKDFFIMFGLIILLILGVLVLILSFIFFMSGYWFPAIPLFLLGAAMLTFAYFPPIKDY